MKTLTRLFRLLHIGFILFKHGLDEIALNTSLLHSLRLLRYFSPLRWRGPHQKPRGKRIREALEELGPLFVKFGQLLSTRCDILPEDIVQELIYLQDRVPSFSSILAQKIIEEALDRPLSQIFQSFDPLPLASASIAQVHAAVLLDKEAVVIKVLRPNIHKKIKQDVALLQTLAKLAQKYWKASRRFKPREIVAEFEKTLVNELDLMREAASASQLKRNFLHSSILYIPKIHWPLTTHNVLVMERIYGLPISDIDGLKQHGFDLKKLAERLIEIFFTQVFRDSFFHADMHPGNILVSSTEPRNPTYITVDFGIMGILSQHDQHYLAENLMAFLKRDYRRVATLHIQSGWVPRSTRIDDFEAAIRTVSEPMFERPLKEISMGQLLFRLFQTAAHFQVNIQPQLILLQKTLLNIEGLSRQLDPEIDLWHTAKPYLEKWMKNQVGVPALLKKIRNHGPFWIEKLPELPHLIYDALHNLSHRSQENSVILSPNLQVVKQNSCFSIKGVCLGTLLGVSLCLIWQAARSYF